MKPIALLLLLSTITATAAQPAAPATVKREIDQLFGALERSGCDFQRNGTWHTATEASTHLHRKYAYLQKKGLVTSAERFIELAATKSSLSGLPYQVRCGRASPMPSGTWFGRRLIEIRAKPAATPR